MDSIKQTKFNYFSIFFILIITLLSVYPLFAKIQKAEFPFYLYSDFGIIDRHHYFPVGKMGEKGTLALVENYKVYPKEGTTCIRIIYRPKKKKTWAGIYWLYPANNWGKLPNTGYDLRGATKLSFYARGKSGGEILGFKAGGLRSRYGDTFTAELTNVELTREWQLYTIPLDGLNLERCIGAFCFHINTDMNPEGAVFYLDEIKYD